MKKELSTEARPPWNETATVEENSELVTSASAG
jgi:hypothetical protein